MPKVKVGKGGFEAAMRKFKRKVNDSGILKDFRSKEYYEKPSEARRRKHKAALARTRNEADSNIEKNY